MYAFKLPNMKIMHGFLVVFNNEDLLEMIKVPSESFNTCNASIQVLVCKDSYFSIKKKSDSLEK